VAALDEIGRTVRSSAAAGEHERDVGHLDSLRECRDALRRRTRGSARHHDAVGARRLLLPDRSQRRRKIEPAQADLPCGAAVARPHLAVRQRPRDDAARRVAGYRGESIRANVAELLRWVGLADHLDAKPATLSGGQQQRVAIARAVVSKPSLLIADEPTGNVDDLIAARLLRLFEELNRQGTTILIATHSQSLVARFPHTGLHLENGELTVIQRRREVPA
jgi:ABC-type dipeptide/oligopeptide/nickel transport system ATPase component